MKTPSVCSRVLTFPSSPPTNGLPLLPSFYDDHLGPPSNVFEDPKRVNFTEFDPDAYDAPFGIQPGELCAIFILFIRHDD